MTRTALADPEQPDTARLTRLFGQLTTCTICGHLSVNPTHPNCERPPTEEP